MAMNYRELGKTGLMVSEIGIGCEGFEEENYQMAPKLLDYAVEAGVNYFDMFSADPEMRKAVGDGIRGRRDKFIIQMHLCTLWKDGQYKRTRELEEVKEGFEEGMRLMETDHFEVGMIHYVDTMADWQTIIDNGVLDYARELKADGKIGHIGISSHNPIVARAAVETGDIEVLMFAVNPCYDLQPASEDYNDLWADCTYFDKYVNMDPDREALYELCQSMGVGITVMKAFGGGDLLTAEMSPARVALTVDQCLHYALTRPAVATVNCGARSVEDLKRSVAYESATDEEKDYAAAFATFPNISWEGHCMYCNHCLPCPSHINIADVTKFLNLTKAQGMVPETVREHYAVLEHHASECIQCGACETRCPFQVKIRENMKEAEAVFGK